MLCVLLVVTCITAIIVAKEYTEQGSHEHGKKQKIRTFTVKLVRILILTDVLLY